MGRTYFFSMIMIFLFFNNINNLEIRAEYDPLTKTIYYDNTKFIAINSYSNFQNFVVADPINAIDQPLPSSVFWFYTIIIIALTIFAGLMSGLTIGYLSIDDLVLELKMSTGSAEEKKQAENVLPILEKRHWLLVTLLLSNSAAMETLPLFLNKLVPEYMAVIISVTLVLIFGEVVPQAICTGPDQIKIAASVAPLTKILMYILSPISYPIAILLDKLLGEHTKSRFQNNDLKALIELHTIKALERLEGDLDKETPLLGESNGLGLHQEQADLMKSVIDIKGIKAMDLMIPFNKVFCFKYEEPLNNQNIKTILENGYSRVPIYKNDDTNDVVGILRLKNLIGIDCNNEKSIRNLGIDLRKPLVISPSITLFELLKEFKKGKSHMAFLTDRVEDLQIKFGLNHKNSLVYDPSLLEKKSSMKVKILGIVTLEDVIEKMINIEILDEDDYDYDKYGNQKKSFKKITFSKERTSIFKGRESELKKILKNSIMKESILITNFNRSDSVTNDYPYSLAKNDNEKFIV